VTPDATADRRQRYDALAAALSTRKSTLHFAHASVALVVTIILTGTAGRVFWKGAPEHLPWGWASGALAAAIFVYAVVRLIVGRVRLKTELADFAQLQSLREQLGLDDPKRLMPR
jgi:hypothetical protein